MDWFLYDGYLRHKRVKGDEFLRELNFLGNLVLGKALYLGMSFHLNSILGVSPDV